MYAYGMFSNYTNFGMKILRENFNARTNSLTISAILKTNVCFFHCFYCDMWGEKIQKTNLQKKNIVKFTFEK